MGKCCFSSQEHGGCSSPQSPAEGLGAVWFLPPSLPASPHYGQQESPPEPGSRGFGAGDPQAATQGLLQAVPQRAAVSSHQGTAELQLCLLHGGEIKLIFKCFLSRSGLLKIKGSCCGNQTCVAQTEEGASRLYLDCGGSLILLLRLVTLCRRWRFHKSDPTANFFFFGQFRQISND